MWRWGMVVLVGCAADPAPSGNGDPTKDVDGDGIDAGDDCDDTLDTVHPGADEVPYDGVDQDCADGDLVDVDADGFDAVVAGGEDCDDGEATVHPDAVEVPRDGVDQDCSGTDLTDVDGDGHGVGDCDDADPTIHPDAEEVWYDGIDQDCRGDCDYDADHDNAVSPEWQSAIVDGSDCDRDPTADAAAPEDCDDTDPSANSQRIVSVFPADGAVDVEAMIQADVRLAEPENSAGIRLLDPAGTEVPSFWFNEGGDWLVLSPTDVTGNFAGYPLLGFTTYTIEVAHSCGIETTTFTTGAGLEPVDPASLVGTTWALEPTSLSGGGFSVVAFLGWSNFALVGVTGSDGGDLDLLVAAPDLFGFQDGCVATGEAHGVDFSTNPVFETPAFDFPVVYPTPAGGSVTIPHEQGTLEATIFGDELVGMTLTGIVDTRLVADAAGLGQNAICNMYGCVACPDGSGVFCIEEAFQLSGGMDTTGAALTPRTEADIAADPGCP